MPLPSLAFLAFAPLLLTTIVAALPFDLHVENHGTNATCVKEARRDLWRRGSGVDTFEVSEEEWTKSACLYKAGGWRLCAEM